MSLKLTAEQIRSFQEDGAVLLQQCFTQKVIEDLKVGVAEVMDSPGKLSESLRATDKEGVYFNDLCNWQRIPAFRRLALNPELGRLAALIMQSSDAVFYHDHVLVKEAHSGCGTPWHQDQPYYPLDGNKNCSMWISLDPVPEDASLRFVKGSHRWSKWFFPRKFATSKAYPTQGELEREYHSIPEVENDPDLEILQWECQPGDVVVFHMRTVHGAPPNPYPSDRRVLSLRWLGDDVALARRAWTCSPPYTGRLQQGDRFQEEDLFPLVWRENC